MARSQNGKTAVGKNKSTGKKASASTASERSRASDVGSRASNLDGWIRGLLAVSVIAVLADVFAHKHSAFSVEYLFGFYGFLGFLGIVALIVIAKGVQRLVTRTETYYDC